jgi:hypothetical protein
MELTSRREAAAASSLLTMEPAARRRILGRRMHRLQCEVTTEGGGVESSRETIDAMGSALVTVDGAKVAGKTSALGAGAEISGAK